MNYIITLRNVVVATVARVRYSHSDTQITTTLEHGEGGNLLQKPTPPGEFFGGVDYQNSDVGGLGNGRELENQEGLKP